RYSQGIRRRARAYGNELGLRAPARGQGTKARDQYARRQGTDKLLEAILRTAPLPCPCVILLRTQRTEPVHVALVRDQRRQSASTVCFRWRVAWLERPGEEGRAKRRAECLLVYDDAAQRTDSIDQPRANAGTTCIGGRAGAMAVWITC